MFKRWKARRKNRKEKIYTTSDFSIKERRNKEKNLVRGILIPGRKTGLYERVVKFLIYLALRIAIRPKKWNDPEKNFKIIDYTFKKIDSQDLIFIPSSIAFYLIMALVPVSTIMFALLNIPGIGQFESTVYKTLSTYIPGLETVFANINNLSATSIAFLVVSVLLSTWIAAGGFSKLIYAQSYLYDFRHTGGYFGNRFRGMMWVLALSAYLNSALVLNVVIHESIEQGISNGAWERVLSTFWSAASIFAHLFIMIVTFFKFSPHFRVKLKNIIPGATVVVIPTFLFMFLYGSITSIWSYSDYGWISVIMYIGMTMLIISNFIFMGVTANAAYNNEFVHGIIEARSKRYR